MSFNIAISIFRFPAVIIMVIIFSGVFSQTIPAHRYIDWSVAGSAYNFSKSHGTVVNVKTFGATGDGITDDFSAISTAVNTFGGTRGTLFFPPGTYLINGCLNLPDSITLLGSGSDSTVLIFLSGENNHSISINGSILSGFTGVSGGYYKNSLQITVDDSTVFTGGDMAEFIQDGNKHMTSSWAMESLGQMLIIDSVAGNVLFLNQPLRMDYDSLLNPRIRRIASRRAISIECLKIERADSTLSQTANIGFLYAYNCRLLGVESRLCNFSHVDVRRSSNITIRSCYFHEGHNYGTGGKAYGVCVHSTSGACLVENCILRSLRHSMLLQSGANGNVFAFNYSTEPFWTDSILPSNSAGDIVLHGNYPYLNLFEGNICQNIVIDDSHGKNGHHNTFFRNRAELYGIFMNNNPASDSVNFLGNEVTNTGNLLGFYYINGVNHFQYGNNIKGTITPAGTANLPDSGYFYNSNPSFWTIIDHFPPIGPPNQISIYSNPAKERFLSGVNLATCSDTVMLNHIRSNYSGSQIFEIRGLFFHQENNVLVVDLYYDSNRADADVSLFDINGATIATSRSGVNRGINRLYVPCSSRLSRGLFLVNVTVDGVSKAGKVVRL